MAHFFHSKRRVIIIDDRTHGITRVRDERVVTHIITDDGDNPEPDQDEDLPPSPWKDRLRYQPPSEN